MYQIIRIVKIILFQGKFNKLMKIILIHLYIKCEKIITETTACLIKKYYINYYKKFKILLLVQFQTIVNCFLIDHENFFINKLWFIYHLTKYNF